MRTREWLMEIFVVLVFAAGLLAACERKEVNKQVPLANETSQLNQRLDRILIEVSPDKNFEGYFLVEQGTLVQIVAKDFPPGVYLHAEICSSDGQKTRSAATSKLDEEGKGSQVFFFPAKWDDGSEFGEDALILKLTWNESGDDVVIPLKFAHK